MRIWLTRIIGALFVLSVVAAPQAAVFAADGVQDTPEQDQGEVIDGDDEGNTDEEVSEVNKGSPGPANSGDSSDSDSSDAEADTEDDRDDGSESGADVETDSSEEEESGDARDEDENSDAVENADTDEATEPGADATGDVNEDDASDDGSESQPGDDAEDGDQSDNESGAVEDEDSDNDRSETESTPNSLSRSSIAPASFDAKDVPLPSYDAASETLTVDITLQSGFSASAGESFVVEFSNWNLEVDSSTSPAAVSGIDGLVAAVDQFDGEITFTFQTGIDSLADGISGSVSFAATANFEACEPSIDPYQPSTTVSFNTPTTSGDIEIDGPECPANTAPVITDVRYDFTWGELFIEAWVVAPPVAGQQVTLTYEQNKLAIDPGPYEVLALATSTGEVFNIGTANASNGVITIDFFDANLPAELESEFSAGILLTGWLQGGTCAASGEPEFHPSGELEFVSNTGEVFVEDYDFFICNLEGPSIFGEWDTDELGQPVIHWTIDTGDLVLDSGVDSYDYLYLGESGGLIYDCDSLTITNVSGEYAVTERYCSDSGFYYDLEPQLEVPYRATVSVTTALALDPENLPLSVVNCVDVWMMGLEPLSGGMQATQSSNGLGGIACYEMFLDLDGGDVLTKTVDKSEALPGETLTYTVEVATSTNLWNVIDLSDTLPEGFEVDPESITCAVQPAIYEMEPCYVHADSTMRVQVREFMPNPEQPWVRQTDPVTITLTYQGELTGEPGSTVVSEACSVRSYVGPILGGEPEAQALMQVEGDQSIVGGGRLCAEASTLVLQPEEPTTPTPSPTPEAPEPTTPEPTGTVEPDPIETTTPDPTGTVEPEPTETPAETATPEVTTPATPGAMPGSPTDPATDPDPGSDDPGTVTGLPSTGQGSTSAGIAVFTAAIAVSMLMAVAVGIRIRSPRS